jgi:hypothetical protein
MLTEPVVLGLLLAFSRPGVGLSLAAVGAFLARHPLRLALSDRRRGARHPRTALAWRFAALYGLLSLVGLALTWGMPALAWTPLVLAAPLGLVQLAYDARLQGRRLLPEVAGGVALGALAAAILLAGHWRTGIAAAAWALLAARNVSSVLYVRTRLRLDRGQRPSHTAAVASHVLALGGAAALALDGVGSWLAVLGFAVLLARAVYGLSPWHEVVRPQTVGFQEVAFGSTSVLLMTAGWAFGL